MSVQKLKKYFTALFFLQDFNFWNVEIIQFLITTFHGVQRRMISVDNFFGIFEIIIFCCVIAI